MPSKLDEIVAAARERVAVSKATLRSNGLGAERHQPRGFRRNLAKCAKSGVAIIAELKKASPSKGLIRADFPVAELARELESAGAAALSVLTDERYFQGSLQNLQLASQATGLPCLRKDFIVDEFQLLEARANRADAVLLIVAALSGTELANLAASRDPARSRCSLRGPRRKRTATRTRCRLRPHRSEQPQPAYVPGRPQYLVRVGRAYAEERREGCRERHRNGRRHRAPAPGRLRRLPHRRVANARSIAGRCAARIVSAGDGGAVMHFVSAVRFRVELAFRPASKPFIFVIPSGLQAARDLRSRLFQRPLKSCPVTNPRVTVSGS